MADTVSVIVPAYNAASFLGAAIESALNQTHPPHELIVIDDGSTDGTREVAAKYAGRIYCLESDHGGVGEARNRGVARASGEFLAFLDADDLFDPAKLERQLAAFRADPSLDITFTHMVQFVEGRPDDVREPQPGLLPGTMMILHSSFIRVGPFLRGVQLAEFMDWLLRAREIGLREDLLPDVLYRRRIHGNNAGIRERDQQVQYVRALKAALDRRRAASRESVT